MQAVPSRKEISIRAYWLERDLYQKRRETKEGVLRCAYSGQCTRSRQRGHAPPAYSLKEFIEYYMTHPDFIRLYYHWIDSGKDTWEKPSFDRLDNSQGYSFENIEVVTWRVNFERSLQI